MSADNWTVCPRCKGVHNLDRETTREGLMAIAAASYGKVSSQQYLEAVRKAEAVPPTEPAETFREDYSIGMTIDGIFMASYTGCCTDCGFEYRYNDQVYTNPVWPDGKPKRGRNAQ